MKKLTLLAALIPVIAFAQNDSIQPDPPFVVIPTAGDCRYPLMAWDRNNIIAGADHGDDSLNDQNRPFVKFTSINVYGGGDFYRDGFEDRTIFQQAAPNSSIAFADISGYTNWDNTIIYSSSMMNATTGMNVNMHLRCQKKTGELRFGFSHSAINIASQYYSQESTTPMDTTWLPGGEVLLTDSIALSQYSLNWDADLLQLHIGWIIRSDPKRWLSFYTGIGFCGGFGYNGVIEMNHNHYSYLYHSSAQSGMNYSSNHEQISLVEEKYRAPGFTSFGIYMPVGMNLRLGTRNNVFKHLALFGEYNGAILFVSPKGLNTKVRTLSAMSGGVRWYIHAPGKPKSDKRKREHSHRQDQRDQGQPKVD